MLAGKPSSLRVCISILYIILYMMMDGWMEIGIGEQEDG